MFSSSTLTSLTFTQQFFSEIVPFFFIESNVGDWRWTWLKTSAYSSLKNGTYQRKSCKLITGAYKTFARSHFCRQIVFKMWSLTADSVSVTMEMPNVETTCACTCWGSYLYKWKEWATKEGLKRPKRASCFKAVRNNIKELKSRNNSGTKLKYSVHDHWLSNWTIENLAVSIVQV